jgi:nucleoside-diphosphate-sugar epimerase
VSRILVTGATGNVGAPIASRLAGEGHDVRALVRSPERAAALLPGEVELVHGDVTDAASVRAAVEGCSLVYHAAGLPEQWLRDPADFTRVNVEGTRNLVEASLQTGVERFAYTSTIDVFAWTPGQPFDESTLDPDPRPTHYERSKQAADALVIGALDRGLPAVFLHPSAVYGPAPTLTPGLNDFLVRLARRKIPMLLPGGMPVVYSEDVAEGHIRAAADAPVGSRYILSTTYHSLEDIARAVAQHVPRAGVPKIMPSTAARAASVLGEGIAKVTKRPPLIPRGTLHFLESHAVPDATRARDELGWSPVGFDEGLRRALDHFGREGWIGDQRISGAAA